MKQSSPKIPVARLSTILAAMREVRRTEGTYNCSDVELDKVIDYIGRLERLLRSTRKAEMRGREG